MIHRQLLWIPFRLEGEGHGAISSAFTNSPYGIQHFRKHGKRCNETFTCSVASTIMNKSGKAFLKSKEQVIMSLYDNQMGVNKAQRVISKRGQWAEHFSPRHISQNFPFNGTSCA